MDEHGVVGFTDALPVVRPHQEQSGAASISTSPRARGRERVALEVLHRGWPLVPIAPRSKGPHAGVLESVHGDRSWSPLAERRPATEADVRAWFRAEPDLNIGVLTGVASGGLVVADFDRVPDDCALLMAILQLGAPIATTGRGLHVYLQGPTYLPTRKFTYGELKATGGYVVAPPSVHPSGAPYEWRVPPRADLLPPLDALLALLPDEAGTSKQGHRRPREASNAYPLLASPTQRAEGLEVPADPGERAGWLRAMASDERMVRLQARALGVPDVALGRAFQCVLHPDRKPSAALYRGDNGIVVYHDFHSVGEPTEFLTLAEVRASLGYGKPVRLRDRKEKPRPELPVWHMRLLLDAGIIEPVGVTLPSLPVNVAEHVRVAAEGFRLLLGCRWHLEVGVPTAYTWRFAAAWCGLSAVKAGKAVAELLRLGVIEKVDEHASMYGKLTGLFLPGGERCHA